MEPAPARVPLIKKDLLVHRDWLRWFEQVAGDAPSGLSPELANLTAAEIQQVENIGAVTISAVQWGYLGALNQALKTTDDVIFNNITVTGTVDGVDVSALKADVDGFPAELKNLTTAEIQQVENIGAVTISAVQWGYLGELNQALKTTSSPQFAGLTLSDDLVIADGKTIGQAAGPLLTFDDTNNYLEITGCSIGIKNTAPDQDIVIGDFSTGANHFIDFQNPSGAYYSGFHLFESSKSYGFSLYYNGNDNNLQLGRYNAGVIVKPVIDIDRATGNLVINEDGLDSDFRIEAVGEANALFIQGSDGNIGTGTATPSVIQGWSVGATDKLLSIVGTGQGLLAVHGGAGASLNLVDTGGGFNDKWGQLKVDAGVMRFASVVDNGSNWRQQYILVMDMGSGNVGINKAVPVAKVDVDQSSTTGAIACLGLDQADVDVSFMKLTGTAAAASLVNSLVDEGDQGSETREGWIKVDIVDDGNQITDQAYYVPFYSLAA